VCLLHTSFAILKSNAVKFTVRWIFILPFFLTVGAVTSFVEEQRKAWVPSEVSTAGVWNRNQSDLATGLNFKLISPVLLKLTSSASFWHYVSVMQLFILP
jgi:hypothetical protein